MTCNNDEVALLSVSSAIERIETLSGNTPAAEATALTKANWSEAVKFVLEMGRLIRMLTANLNCVQELEAFAPALENPQLGQATPALAPPVQNKFGGHSWQVDGGGRD